MSSLQFRLQLQPRTECIRDQEDLRDWLEKTRVTANTDTPFGYNFGKDEPGVDNRDKPWFRYDASGVFLGIYLWESTLANPVGAWVPVPVWKVGELITVVTTEPTVAADRAAKGLDVDWALADGGGAIDLTSEPSRFQGTAPDYDLYTLYFTG